MLNLEPLAAKAAADMMSQTEDYVKNDENMISKALLVLSEQGLFAFGLFLATRKPSRPQDVEAAKNIHRAVTHLLSQAELAQEGLPLSPDYYRDLTNSRENEDEITALQRILLTKQIVEIALTYGRYHAKARAKAHT